MRRARGPRRERDSAAGAGPRLRKGEGQAGGGGGRLRAELSAPPLRSPPSSADRHTAMWITRECSAGPWTASSAPSRGASCGAAGPASGRGSLK